MTTLGYLVLGRPGPGQPWSVIEDDNEVVTERSTADLILTRAVEEATVPDDDDEPANPTAGWEHQIAVVVGPDQWDRIARVARAHIAYRQTVRDLAAETEQPKVNKAEQDRLIAAMQAAEAEMTAAVDAIDPEVNRA